VDSIRRPQKPRHLLVLILPTLLLTAAWFAVVSPPARAFTDTSGTPFVQAIDALAARGIVSGYGDGRFAPADPMTRVQFGKLIVLALRLPLQQTNTPFTDISKADSKDPLFQQYVAAIYAYGITQGTTPTTFSPWDRVVRAQGVTMAVRGLGSRAPLALKSVPSSYQSSWGTSFDSTHGPEARTAEYNGLLGGLDLTGGAADPWGALSRGEAAQIVWNLVKSAEVVHPTAGATCGGCHSTEQAAWSSPLDHHAASAADVLLNDGHNQAEGLPQAQGAAPNPEHPTPNECFVCHSPFEAAGFTVGDFVQPLNLGTDNGGPALPAGSWHLLTAADHWQATKCEVCHDPSSTNPYKLAKYNGDTGSYDSLSSAAPVSHVYSFTTKAFTDVPLTPGVSAQATTLCDSCHDPSDEGGDNPPQGLETYGPQGGDSRAYVTGSHQTLGCNDCHLLTHDFQPADPATTPSCQGSACHSVDRSKQGPGVVHINHLG
jgi:hypothetical protein